ncbi:hypothetical protein M378DRAFT_158575 [Amanita muscaria Koide BX008]|uniref:Uncharacterized protein n=1 Tax=Amanita muscaria (strain Koide BX008) TaxID=946122 RepID=A0A0C2X1S0_AMAMK|nr:hypothetical protein M378DRAFT_158575 [Amanita muscaria Koide BX008]
MRLSAALFALFAFPTLVTSIPLLDSVDDGYVNVSKRLDKQNIDKRQLSDTMIDIVDAVDVFADEYNHHRGYNFDHVEFTQNIVQALYNHNPHFNYIICYTDHNYDFGSPWESTYTTYGCFTKSQTGLALNPSGMTS